MFVINLLAQAAVAAAPVPPAAPQQGVTSYPAAFFAAQNPGTALDMVQRLPGFTLDAGASVRGYEGAAGNVLINGQRPASKTDSLQEILKRLPASDVERIDVVQGGAPGIDMQGKSVLANVIRKKGASFHSVFAVAYNHDDDGRDVGATRIEANGGLGPGKWEFGSYFGKGIDDGAGQGPGFHVFADGRPPLISFIDTEGDVLSGQLTGAYETPLFGGNLRVNGRWYKDKYKFNELDRVLSPTPGFDTSVEFDRTREAEGGFNYTRAFGAKLNLEVVGLRHPKTLTIDSLAGERSTPQRFLLDRETVETIGRAVLKYQASGQLSLEGGAETAINTLDSKTRFTEGGVEVPLPAANVQVEEDRSEAFVKGVWRPSPAWTVDAGLRYESSKLTSEGDLVLGKTLTFLKPRLTVIWSPTPKTQLRARIEREVGQLNFNDFVASASLTTASGVTAGNPDLNPEQAWVGEIAVEQQFWSGADISMALRHYEITDAIDRGPVFAANGDVFDRPTNIGEGTKDELVVNLTLPLDRFGISHGLLKGDLTRRVSEVTDPTTQGRRGISALHPVDWNGHFSQDIPRWKLSWGVDAFGGLRETYYRFNLIETLKVRTYVIPWAEWRPRRDFSVRVEIDNATARNVRRTDLIWPGPRSSGAAPDIEDRNLDNGRIYYIRLRKTFGS